MQVKVRIVLYVIILGLVINILANLAFHYLPETHPYTYLIATIVLVAICVLLVIFNKDDSSAVDSKPVMGSYVEVMDIKNDRRELSHILNELQLTNKKTDLLDQVNKLQAKSEYYRRKISKKAMRRLIAQKITTFLSIIGIEFSQRWKYCRSKNMVS